jgi:Collagen triple helix repeat (20 copies)
MPTSTKRSAPMAVLTVSVLLLSGLAAAPQAGAATLYACVKKKGGTARFVNARTNCRRGETKLSWNTQGVPGRNGSNGKNGAAGKNGTNGKNGTDGKAGTNGKDGANGANGASTGIVDFSDSPFELPLTRTAVATLPSVPPGSYVLLAKTQIEDANVTEGVTVHCYLAGDEALAELAPKGGSATISLLGVAVSPLTASISLECNDFGTAGVKVSFARLIAIQVQTLSGTTS